MLSINEIKEIFINKYNVVVFDYSNIISTSDKIESNFDDYIKEKIGLYT